MHSFQSVLKLIDRKLGHVGFSCVHFYLFIIIIIRTNQAGKEGEQENSRNDSGMRWSVQDSEFWREDVLSE